MRERERKTRQTTVATYLKQRWEKAETDRHRDRVEQSEVFVVLFIVVLSDTRTPDDDDGSSHCMMDLCDLAPPCT